MSKACVVPFFKYEPAARGNYKILLRFFIRHLRLWSKTIDHLYLIDSGPGFTEADLKPLAELVPTTVYRARSDSHWGNLNEYLPKITEEKFILIDSDTIFSNPNTVEKIFQDLDQHDIVSMTDGSGAVDLWKDFPEFAANENRDIRRRFAPYLFGCRTEFFKRIGAFDFTPITGSAWTDSMGAVSAQLLALKPRFLELQDDRSSIYFFPDRAYQSHANLDGSGGRWCSNELRDFGYYHIRNFNGGLQLVEKRALNALSYKHERAIMPRQEAFRLLAWLWILSNDNQYQSEILNVVRDYGSSPDEFAHYLQAFSEYHSWIARI